MTLTQREPLESNLLGELFMKYTIKKLAQLAGVSTRTLRYYDEIGLLNSSEINENNYRIYNEKNVNKLQQILFYRSLDFPLSEIKQLLDDPDFSHLKALKEQQSLLLEKRNQVDALLTNITNTIADYQGEITMTDSEKFAAFKKEQLEKNETEFGNEIRQNYGTDMVEQSNKKYGQLSKEDFDQMEKMESQLIADLVTLKQNPDLDSALAKKIYQEHKSWLQFTWPKYTKEMHKGLVEMYVSDDRFAKYYNDKAKTDVTTLLRDVILHITVL